jgi:hypothetical protein
VYDVHEDWGEWMMRVRYAEQSDGFVALGFFALQSHRQIELRNEFLGCDEAQVMSGCAID